MHIDRVAGRAGHYSMSQQDSGHCMTHTSRETSIRGVFHYNPNQNLSLLASCSLFMFDSKIFSFK